MNNLSENLDTVSARIKRACEGCGRAPTEVRLLAVSKRHSAERIRLAHSWGQPAFGENTVQEALTKQQQLADLALEWHFIGAIQSNKTRDIAEHFHWAQGVDREKLLLRLSKQRPVTLPPLNICLQVNIDAEPQKAGLLPEQVEPLARLALTLPGIHLRGLMAIPANQAQGGAAEASFRAVKELYDGLRERGIDLDTLSMGMSADMERAIAAGSTMVRVGTDIFGTRP